jgi:GT2 family glycosyltransferase
MVDVCGFDEAFPVAAGEDADLKWRICAQGYKLLYVPVKVVHLQKYTWSEFRRQQIRHGVGDIYFSRKHSKPTLKHRVALRVIKRALKFLPDATRMPSKIAWVKMWSGIYECYGQWTELSKLEKSNRGKA